MTDLADAVEAAASPETWRQYVRQWLAEHRPEQPAAGAPLVECVQFDRNWIRELHSGGLAAPGWPAWAGGLELTPAHEIALHEEMIAADVRWPRTFYAALNHAGRAIITHGSDEQRQRCLPAVLDGSTVWCQAFSEPDAGSDLASLRTTARRDGDHYVVNGQKVWASGAAYADRAILLVRTNPDLPRHRGISFFLLDMRSPGVTVRPIQTMTGESEFCEIFLDDVSVPVSDRVGDEDGGWPVVHTVLSAERGPGFLRFVIDLNHVVDGLVSRACRSDQHGGRPIDDPYRRNQLAKLVSDADVLTTVLERVLRELAATGRLSPASSIVKVMFAELHRAITTVAVEMEGLAALLIEPDFDAGHQEDSPAGWMMHHLRSWVYLLGGGTSEIQRNQIAEGVLSLPKEPRVQPPHDAERKAQL